MEDKLNKDPVNDYIGVASLDMFEGRSYLELTYPKNLSGSNIIGTDQIFANSPIAIAKAPSWSGSAFLYNTLINRYNANQWAQTYTEHLNLNSLVLRLT